ncbi:MAG: hypothetical protein M0042_16755 [Nitrospiraceae bacterium]|nr:hypothetical protein [Nitrospiraceae bacterium]
MLTKGGQKAAAGTYWDVMNGSRVVLSAEGTLPGGPETLYLKASAAVMLAAGPVLGLIFAVFLPFVGIVMAISLGIRKISEGITEAAAAGTSLAWRPMEAYLAGSRKRKAAYGKDGEKNS